VTLTNFWQLLAGLSLFLYGMFHLEDSMKQQEGRAFKLFLKKHTKNKLSAIFSGTFVTAILQSSSIVNLMVLSFVGAGVLSMRNALGVVLGANIVGTVNSWLVALLGFKVDMGAATMPIIGIAGIGLVIFKENKNYYNICRFILGFGLLFMGLDFMKQSMNSAMLNFDFKPYLKYHKIVFLLIGFVITALIQTSAATIVIVLSALNAKIIPLETAVVVVLGAELGTTLKVIIGAIGGIAAKKRVALGNGIFNIVSTAFGFLLLGPIVILIQNIIGIKDPLIILVAFQSLVNLMGGLLFYFFLNQLGDFLERSFVKSEKFATIYLHHASPEMPDAAAEVFEKEVNIFIQRVLFINEEIFVLNEIKGKDYFETNNNLLFEPDMTLLKKYEVIKKAEGEMLQFYALLLKENIDNESLNKVNRLLSAVRSALFAAKSLKDIIQNVKEFSNSSADIKYNRFKDFQKSIDKFNTNYRAIFLAANHDNAAEQLQNLQNTVEADYQQDVLKTYQQVSKGTLTETNISTAFNINREIHDSCKSLITAAKDFLLNESQEVNFSNVEKNNIKSI
jgi:phosphate:Na+ symporter